MIRLKYDSYNCLIISSSDPWNAFDSAPAGGFGFESSFGQTDTSPSDGKSSQIIPQKKAPSRPPPPRPNP